MMEVMPDKYLIGVVELRKHPFAMIECKRVGIEEGAKKGPTTIEKAKQGAYVAKHVSALQKIRRFDGEMFGAMAKPDGTIELRPWKEEFARLIRTATAAELAGFIMTVGVVSNHGNWFTGTNLNKELLVLRQSYDWLLFLSDAGIAQFVQETIRSDDPKMKPVRDAFKVSYVSGTAGKNQFTKVKIAIDAHETLCKYFADQIKAIERDWFSVLSPIGEGVPILRKELEMLREKDWAAVVSPGDEAIEVIGEEPAAVE